MVNLGMPSTPPPTLAPRRKSKQLKVGSVLVGGDAPVSVQSMCTTLTSDVNATLQQIAELTMEAARLRTMKVAQEDSVARQKEVNITPQQTTQTARVDPKAEDWASKNNWFGQDSAMTYTAFDLHKKLVEEEGIDPKSDEYYEEIDKRIRLEFPHKFATKDTTTTTERAKPAQTVASANRPSQSGRKKTVRLTPSQVAISKKLGVPLSEYAKYVKE